MQRNSVNKIIPGKLYQRGQILTWQPEVKYEFFREHRITLVANFWPKLDPDLAGAPIRQYLHLPAPRSEEMLSSRMDMAANYIAALLRKKEVALILCEAGVTRSVYFCVLVVSHLLNVDLEEAFHQVESRMPKVRLKGFMMDRIGRGVAK